MGLDPTGWDFVFGYYDLDEMPALLILELGEEPEARGGATRAISVAADYIASVAAYGLGADPTVAAASEGERRHLRGDAELLPHESTQGIVQRPMIDSGRAGDLRREGRTVIGVPKPKISQRTIHAVVDDDGVMPPDLWLRIRHEDSTLKFELTSDRAGYHGTPMGETKLGGEPRQYREDLKDKIAAIAARREASDVEQLETLGHSIYDRLFPDELKNAYGKFRKDERLQTLQITSEEPYIPWELARPCDWDDWQADDFLCAKYAMTRWLVGAPPKVAFEIAAIASIEAGAVVGEERLETAKEECAHLARLAARRQVDNLSPASATYDDLTSLLRNDQVEVQLWHVAAHGRLGQADPDESLIVLDGRPWRAGDLYGRNGSLIRRSHPLVFFNACLVGQQDFVLGQLAGWPQAWVVQGRCGGFIAPQWSVKSDLATVFSKAFYEAVVGDDPEAEPQTLGEAARTARLAVRKADPIDPAWLSYAVYGHPKARVFFGARDHEAVA